MSVLNIRRVGYPHGAVIIDRRSSYGNPFIIGKDGNRADVIEKFRAWWYLPENKLLRDKAKRELIGKDLLCWCEPEACHGHVIEGFLKHGS